MKTSLTEIKKTVLSKGGDYSKLKIKLNGNDAYNVDGKIYTKSQMINAYNEGSL